VIVVVGGLAWRDGAPPGPGGRACEVALAAASSGASVEVVGRAGDDPTGDALMLALAQARIGHVAVLRDVARTPVLPRLPTADDEAADDVGAAMIEQEPAVDGDPMVPVTGPQLAAGDVSLGLRYLSAFDVLVVTDDIPEAAVPVAVEAAGFAGARLVLLVAGADAAVALFALPSDATVLRVPDADDGSFAGMVGAYAAGLDRGLDPAQAFRLAVASVGGEPLEAVP